MLTLRIETILRELVAVSTPITGSYLATLNRVTSRTIREDIKTLDLSLVSNGAYIDSIMGQGYKLRITDEQLFRNYLKRVSGDESTVEKGIPKLPEERVTYLIKRFLLSERYIKLDDLADEMYVSKSTIQNDLVQVKNKLSLYDIRLEARPNYGLKVNADELKLRFCMAEYIFERREGKAKQLFGSHFSLLSQSELDSLLEIIVSQINFHRITVSDIAINNLVIHMAIAYKRIKDGYHINLYKTDLDEIVEQKEYQVASEIVRKVEEQFQVEFPQEETAYIALHLLGTKILLQMNATNKIIKEVVEEDISKIVGKMLDKIESKLNLGVCEDKELIIALSLHLKPAVNRYKYGMNVRNPMLEDIKKNYPLAFEAGVIAGAMINEHLGIEVDENEIGYLALHLGAAIERRKSKIGPKKCLIVCASGLGTAQLIYYKLKNQFGEGLELVGTTEYYKLRQYNLLDIDFIVSSIPIQEQLPVPVIVVNAILGDSDIRKIEEFIVHTNHKFNAFFQEELMFLTKSFESQEETLEFLYTTLLEKGLVDQTFLDAIYEREKVAPTSFGNLVAIPHPITPNSDKTFLAVCTLAKPIMWNDKPVQFICLLSVKKNSQEDLQGMYDLLGEIIHDSSIVEKLIKVKTYEAFMKVLSKEKA
ncbi:BglG family transcription antiterminator [Sporosarcina beigongshangi]|uniref:BglG family transcription antiterminator n=1 Tax=Sporosarcina beigongshangi TaxID=2782538 RepID=UPI001939C385|nr:BglG family transcription antiterminator [Sporosarcina beigongshangi]